MAKRDLKINIKDKTISPPLIQGGMGIGVSRSKLAGAVAATGAMGVISTAQVGYDAPDFRKDPEAANLRELPIQIQKAREISGGKGMIAVNIMYLTQLLEEYIDTVCKAGVDAIISGAGLPTDLPLYARKYDVAIAPIVSTAKSAKVILKYWDVKHNTTADFLVIEGPKAGGHLGFKREELEDIEALNYDEEIKQIIEVKKEYEAKYNVKMPVFVAGGIFSAEDVDKAIALGADGVQVATKFVATKECDASDAYKEAYVKAKAEDVVITQSPVGLPGRAVLNPFMKRLKEGNLPITWCYNCLKACNPKTAAYCISQALINAVQGDLENGLIFCGYRVGEIDKISTVPAVVAELFPE